MQSTVPSCRCPLAHRSGEAPRLCPVSPKGNTGPVCLWCPPATDWRNPQRFQGSLLPDGHSRLCWKGEELGEKCHFSSGKPPRLSQSEPRCAFLSWMELLHLCFSSSLAQLPKPLSRPPERIWTLCRTVSSPRVNAASQGLSPRKLWSSEPPPEAIWTARASLRCRETASTRRPSCPGEVLLRSGSRHISGAV